MYLVSFFIEINVIYLIYFLTVETEYSMNNPAIVMQRTYVSPRIHQCVGYWIGPGAMQLCAKNIASCSSLTNLVFNSVVFMCYNFALRCYFNIV